MAKKNKRTAVISSFLPRKCGIATFSADLIRNIGLVSNATFEPVGLAMQPDNECRYGEPVKFEIRRNVRNDYFSAAEFINCSSIDVVLVQHEFGLFGGAGGDFLSLLLRRLTVPVIVNLHTVLAEPLPAYRKALCELSEIASKLIVMNRAGISMLEEVYSVPREKIELIPHGIAEVPFEETHRYKSQLSFDGRRTILTFGLLGRNKGIEVMLRAMPEIVKACPDVLYIVLGATHPDVLRMEGEAYRFSLHRLARELGVQDHVAFHNRFVNDAELREYVCAADLYITPYLHEQQLTSGTLARAVGTGKAIISTPYWAAQELLAENRGRLVPFNDSHALAQSAIEILSDDTLHATMRRRAWQYGTSMTWPRVAAAYWKLLNMRLAPVHLALPVEEPPASYDVPTPSIGHILRLSDDTGLFQHARFTLPDRRFGYCTDDNSRALIVMAKYYSQFAGSEALRLFNLYLSFCLAAQQPDGSIRNFMNFDRSWSLPEPANDALGRTLWAFGSAMSMAPSPAYIPILKEAFDRSATLLETQSLRGNAYAILGFADYLQVFPGASETKRALAACADKLLASYRHYHIPDWQWFENHLLYDNAVLPHALFVAAKTLETPECLEVAKKAADFLLAATFNGNNFSFIGSNGFYPQKGPRAVFDQQPIEAAATVLMARAAAEVTGDPNYLTLQRKAFDWFLGANDHSIPVYDFRTDGCCDALTENGINTNQGAESTLSFILSLLSVIETFSARSDQDRKRVASMHPAQAQTQPQPAPP